MKKLFLSVFTIAAFAFYVLYHRMGWNSVPVSTLEPVDPSSMNPVAETETILYKDGEYTGVSVDAFYGRVQVVAIIEGGKITDVKFLDYPQEQATSVQISGAAVKVLRVEAIQTQKAQVDIVSGATQTSKAFRESMASALAQAK